MVKQGNHVTLDCPACGVEDRAVGEPRKDETGGTWYCFNCKSYGKFSYDLEVTTYGEGYEHSVPGSVGSGTSDADAPTALPGRPPTDTDNE